MNKKNMHLIINTHWDREYRWSFPETQLRLGEAVDDLIDIMNRDKNFTYFHTDSQVSMMDDYIDIRPERAEELKKLIKEGRILTGPWYTLPAEFLVSAEALTRNLLLGHRIAGELGGVMKAGYNIFSWGQVSQLPQIYRQFGMDTIIFYRGIDQSSLKNLEFKWNAPDGTQALGITFGAFHRLNFWRYVYLPYIMGKNGVSRDALQNGWMFNMTDGESADFNHQVINQPCARDFEAAIEGMKELIDTVAEKSSVEDLLFLQGFDQENPDPIVSELVEKINRDGRYGTLKVSSLPEYIKTISEKLKERGIYDTLEERTGEMLEVERVHDAFGPLYNGVFSARMPIKLANGKSQYILEKWAEPMSVFAMMNKADYPGVALEKAWKGLLQNQQHDGIGGCHVDRISRTMLEKYEIVWDGANAVTKNAAKYLTANIDASAVGEKEIGIVVFNPTQYTRSELVEMTVDVPISWGLRYKENGRREISVLCRDYSGESVRVQILSVEDDTVYGYLKFGNVTEMKTSRVKLLVNAENVPGFGYKSFILTPVQAADRAIEKISARDLCMENEYLCVQINSNGTLSVRDKQTNIEYNRLHYFEDSSDKGGPLKFDMAYEQGTYTTLAHSPEISLIYNGRLRATYKVRYEWKLPESIAANLRIHVPHGSEWMDIGKPERSGKYDYVVIETYISLSAGSRRIDFETTIDNHVRDHRLRVKFATGFSEEKQVFADSHYDVVTRDIAVPDSSDWYEEAARTYPSQSFVMIGSSDANAAVYHNSIPEYEVEDNVDRTIALTLLRAISTAGNPTETYQYQELAQCIGKHTFRYAFESGRGADKTNAVRESTIFNVPMKSAQVTKHQGTLAPEGSFMSVDNDSFVVTAIKKAEYDNDIILRGYNVTDKPENVRISCRKTKHVQKVTLEEIAGCDMTVENESFTDSVRGGEIASYKIALSDSKN